MDPAEETGTLLPARIRSQQEQHILELLCVNREMDTVRLSDHLGLGDYQNPLSGMSNLLRRMEAQGLVRQVSKGAPGAPGVWTLREYQPTSL